MDPLVHLAHVLLASHFHLALPLVPVLPVPLCNRSVRLLPAGLEFQGALGLHDDPWDHLPRFLQCPLVDHLSPPRPVVLFLPEYLCLQEAQADHLLQERHWSQWDPCLLVHLGLLSVQGGQVSHLSLLSQQLHSFLVHPVLHLDHCYPLVLFHQIPHQCHAFLVSQEFLSDLQLPLHQVLPSHPSLHLDHSCLSLPFFP